MMSWIQGQMRCCRLPDSQITAETEFELVTWLVVGR